MLKQEINLHIKVTAKTYETDHGTPFTSRIRGRRKLSKPSIIENRIFVFPYHYENRTTGQKLVFLLQQVAMH